MILKSKEAHCTFQILKILSKGKGKYTQMFKTTKVSHTTLQSVLKWLVEKKFVLKKDIGHMNVDYELTDKGKEFLKVLCHIEKLM